MNPLFRGLIIVGGLLMVAQCTFAQGWVPTGAPALQGLEPWAMAASADGERLIAAYVSESSRLFPDSAGPIFTSTNSGLTWVSNNIPEADWSAVTISADGMKLAAAVNGGGIYTSSDGGTSWRLSGAPSASWVGLAASTDGNDLFAAAYGSYLYYSKNFGTNWSIVTSILGEYAYNNWGTVACSASGEILLATVLGDNPLVFISTDSGFSWVTSTYIPSAWYGAVFSSATGDRLFIGGSWGVYESSDYGVTWTNLVLGYSSPYDQAVSAVSADGSELVGAGAIIYNGTGANDYSESIYTSPDGGATWVSNSAPVTNWTVFASSADGNKLFAAYSGGIYMRQVTPRPSVNLAPASKGLELSWIAPSTNFVLQENSDLTASNWVSLTNTPTLNLSNLNDEVVLSPSNRGGFFRLMSQ